MQQAQQQKMIEIAVNAIGIAVENNENSSKVQQKMIEIAVENKAIENDRNSSRKQKK